MVLTVLRIPSETATTADRAASVMVPIMDVSSSVDTIF